ncbi:MAG TPA: TIR domain-containing protein [Phototrophicaceae bacterium]|nr:TIR domain-containing protein [Phototrophicaceae bacterium]
MTDYNEENLLDDDEAIEAFCVRCRQTVAMDDPQPVWTRRGMPAMRGECPDCGGVVFRMGRTAAHNTETRPAAIQVAERTRAKLAQDTAYVAFAEADAALAEQLAEDLQKAGIATWLHESAPANVHWAGGVHPALKECARLVLVLSPASLADSSVETAWRFFKEKGKRIVLAQLVTVDPPDAIRRSPRFDFTGDYKTVFRQMVNTLAE